MRRRNGAQRHGRGEIKPYWRLVALAMASLPAAAWSAGGDPEDARCARGPVSEITESIRQRFDEQTGITWYTDRSTIEQVDHDAFYLYAGRKDCDVWLRLRVQYVSEKPVAMTRFEIKADGKTFELAEAGFKRDSDGALVRHWWDQHVTADHLLMLFSIAAANSAVLRFVGANRTEERALGEQEKGALKAVLSTYRALGGQL
jgi:hypothetical protein